MLHMVKRRHRYYTLFVLFNGKNCVSYIHDAVELGTKESMLSGVILFLGLSTFSTAQRMPYEIAIIL